MDKHTLDNQIADSILKVVVYADLFDFPLTIDEILNDIPETQVTKETLDKLIGSSNGSMQLLDKRDGFFFLKGRDELVTLRKQKEQSTRQLLQKHKNKIQRICNLPWVRCVALSGSAAFDNADLHDDIDLFIIVKSNRVWLVDLYNLLILRFMNEKLLRRKRSICPNYIIDEAAIALQERDFFTAHQAVHMKPVYDEGIWDYFIKTNNWAWETFPHAEKHNVTISNPDIRKYLVEKICDFLGAGILNSIIFAIRGKRLARMNLQGMLKGRYRLRQLRANDSRLSSIVLRRMQRSLAKLNGKKETFDVLCDSSITNATENGITACIPEKKKKAIDTFLKYYSTVNPDTCNNRLDDFLLSLPFAHRRFNNRNLWKQRAGNYLKVAGLIRTSEPHGYGPILDLGAGNCWLSRRLIDQGYSVVSIDPLKDSENGLKSGDVFERVLDIKLTRIQGVMEDLPFIDSSFRGIVASGSFHYSNDPAAALLEIKRVLKKNGWAIIYDSPVFHNDIDGRAMIKNKQREFDLSDESVSLDYQPVWFINLEKFLREADKTGFKVRVIRTRSDLKRIGDRIKNGLTSRRKWPEFPILYLTDKSDVRENFKQNLVQKVRYLYHRQFVEPGLIPEKPFVLNGIYMKVPAGVFHPLPFDSSRILLKLLTEKYPDLSCKTVLDMGTGSGIHAIRCAKSGADVIAVDIKLRCFNRIRINAVLNGVGDKINFLVSDLFSKCKKKSFDLILFNPPFYNAPEKSGPDSAWYDYDNRTLVSFINYLPHYLRNKGESLVVLSDRMDLNLFEIMLHKAGLHKQVILKKRVWDEIYFVFLLRLSSK